MMSTKDVDEIEGRSPQKDTEPKALSRRALLKGSVATMPVILTMHSGAALARSSNLISAASYSTHDRLGRTLCLDTESVDRVDGARHRFDLGEPPRAHVIAINERDYKAAPHPNAPRVSEEQICMRGETAYYRDRRHGWHDGDSDDSSESEDVEWGQQSSGSRDDADGRNLGHWSKIEVRQGVLVSATALTSFAGSIKITDL